VRALEEGSGVVLVQVLPPSKWSDKSDCLAGKFAVANILIHGGEVKRPPLSVTGDLDVEDETWVTDMGCGR